MIALFRPMILLLLLSVIVTVLSQDHSDYHGDYPIRLGPFPLHQYPEFTFGPSPFTGWVWVRMNAGLDRIQFKYQLDQQHPEQTPYWPFFAMHLHVGEVKAGNKGGPIAVTIRGKGDITGYVSPSSPLENSICSSQCLPAAIGCDPNCPPDNTFPYTFAYAYACDGGCNGDERDGDGDRALAPSRYCDLDNDNSSNPPQNVWMSGRYSDERSGNSTDEGYSPYSIFKRGNFDKFCSYEIDFLPTLFEPGVYTYVALHTNYNATGAPDLLYGTVLSIINDGNGIDLGSVASPPPDAEFGCKRTAAHSPRNPRGAQRNPHQLPVQNLC